MNKIKKRDGRIVSFKQEKIASAISKTGKETGEFDLSQAEKLSNKVVEKLNQVVTGIPTVEQVQDIVEDVLLDSRFKKTATCPILCKD